MLVGYRAVLQHTANSCVTVECNMKARLLIMEEKDLGRAWK
jgi:hypothetical protein